jgi:DNA-binding NarL/FixJ family response regulator
MARWVEAVTSGRPALALAAVESAAVSTSAPTRHPAARRRLPTRAIVPPHGPGAAATNAEIAADLFIADVTVKSHINHLFAKIGVRSRAEAVRYAYGHGLAAPFA